MPLPSIDGDSYQVRIKWTLHGQECFNVLNFNNRGVQDLIDDLLIPILDCIVTNLLPVLSNELTLLGADVKNISGTTAQEGEHLLTTGNQGGTDEDSLPSFNSARINLKTSHPGRTGRGRMSLLGIPEGNQSSSIVDSAFLVAAASFVACMFAAYVNSDPLATPFFHWSIRSRKDAALYHITSAATKSTIGTQRSRMIG